jgi:hypothetical protein
MEFFMSGSRIKSMLNLSLNLNFFKRNDEKKDKETINKNIEIMKKTHSKLHAKFIEASFKERALRSEYDTLFKTNPNPDDPQLIKINKDIAALRINEMNRELNKMERAHKNILPDTQSPSYGLGGW